MAVIKHLFHINAPREKVYEALTSIDGLSNWWTKDTTGESTVGGVLDFRFGGNFGNKMKVTHLVPGELVQWECVDGSPDWICTKLTFNIDSNDNKTRIRFEHAGWEDTNDFYGACSFAWARYMESLRQLCQTGAGEAFGSENY